MIISQGEVENPTDLIVHTSTCHVYYFLEGKGSFKVVRLREPCAPAVSWKRREVSRSSVYQRLQKPFAETVVMFGDGGVYPESQLMRDERRVLDAQHRGGGAPEADAGMRVKAGDKRPPTPALRCVVPEDGIARGRYPRYD